MNIQDNTIILPLPTDNLIRKREEIWKVELPTDYKVFIKRGNGGVPERRTFIFQGRNYLLQRFLGLLENVSDSSLGWYDIDVVESQIGERLTDNFDLVGIEVLPIAEIFGGDYLCFDFRTDTTKPSICLWFHELSGEFAPHTEKVADSFSEFLEMLC
ncbi:SMI1/KNR4 family protein [Streptococcus suis]|uniref:SMI1/KNR4 family protein n=1 Tax=Streptococcus suis TaxID=1307 RepID=UPI000CF429AE|nr:SMI1/KNR4 family protein [Streptococcus suis]